MTVKSRDRCIADQIIAIERKALDRWAKGDPMGFVEISSPDVVFFDPYTDLRIDGREALRRYFAPLSDKIHNNYYELIGPKVQIHGDIAVLTYNYVSYKTADCSAKESRWNCTENFLLRGDQWRLIHSHWSRTLGDLVGPLGRDGDD